MEEDLKKLEVVNKIKSHALLYIENQSKNFTIEELEEILTDFIKENHNLYNSFI